YNQMMTEPAVARAFAEAVAAYDPDLPVLVLAGRGGDLMRSAVDAAGLEAVAEAFPDRAYLQDGTLAPRQLPGSVLADPGVIAERAVAMATGTPFAALDGGEARVEAATLCLHGDGNSAPAAAAAVRAALERAGIDVRAF
ncbi:MAG TPA: LamB/YcsF family protein, partial [Trueperaceae bacterium]|nr:LamB/YcsF family protein [Trueperaceae bacterium]